MDHSLFGRIQKNRQKNQIERQRNQRDQAQQVREHELKHLKAAGEYAQGVQFKYRRDGNNIEHLAYGLVHVDISTTADFEHTIQKFQTLIKAADAVDNPSVQDKRLRAHLADELSKLKRFKR